MSHRRISFVPKILFRFFCAAKNFLFYFKFNSKTNTGGIQEGVKGRSIHISIISHLLKITFSTSTSSAQWMAK